MLAEILARTRRRVARLSMNEVRNAALEAGEVRAFGPRLRAPGLGVIAEFKRASPSGGVFDPRRDPADTARRFEAGGAAALSVLTEPRFFLGSLDDLGAARAAVDLPVLRKDFILHPVQVWEARAAGADAVLLIAAILDDQALLLLLEETHRAGMEALVEVHTPDEARRALAAGAPIIGVNNRDLATLEIDLSTAEMIAPLVGGSATLVAESGIWEPAHARRMAVAGYDAVLVGESLIRAADPAGLLAKLRDVSR